MIINDLAHYLRLESWIDIYSGLCLQLDYTDENETRGEMSGCITRVIANPPLIYGYLN